MVMLERCFICAAGHRDQLPKQRASQSGDGFVGQRAILGTTPSGMDRPTRSSPTRSCCHLEPPTRTARSLPQNDLNEKAIARVQLGQDL